jgi:hypothetical protein
MHPGSSAQMRQQAGGPLDLAGHALTIHVRAWRYKQGVTTWLFLRTDGTGNEQYHLLVTSTDQLQFLTKDSGGTIRASTSAAGVVPARTWFTAAGRYSRAGSGEFACFLNGKIVGNVIAQTDLIPAANDISQVGLIWEGVIAEIAFWGEALSYTELMQLARGYSPALIRPGHLRAFYPMVSGGTSTSGITAEPNQTGWGVYDSGGTNRTALVENSNPAPANGPPVIIDPLSSKGLLRRMPFVAAAFQQRIIRFVG